MTERHVIRRVRRETRRRQLTVARVEQFGDAMRRVWLTGDDLADFASDAPDDHVKLFFDDGSGGSVARDYTPRRFDQSQRMLAVDFALHGDDDEDGPATAWARRATPGDALVVGGPRGSAIVPDDFDWYLLIGDESAAPAIGRRIEELRDDAVVIVVLSVRTGRERPPLPEHPCLTPIWSARAGEVDGGAALLASLHVVALPPGDGFVWIGAEAQAARAARDRLVACGHPKAWLKASGYWQAGAAGTHTKLADD